MIRNYCKVLIGMLLLVAALPTSARSFTLQGEASEPSLCENVVITLDNKNVQEGKVGQKTEAYIEQRGMIRRGATTALFIPKGQWMVGGQIGWNQWNSENLNPEYLIKAMRDRLGILPEDGAYDEVWYKILRIGFHDEKGVGAGKWFR